MDRLIARANIDHYLSILNSTGLNAANRATIIKLLIAEQNKLARDLEELEFVEVRTAQCWERVIRFTNLRDGHVDGSADHKRVSRLLAAAEEIHQLMDQLCRQMREVVGPRRI